MTALGGNCVYFCHLSVCLSVCLYLVIHLYNLYECYRQPMTDFYENSRETLEIILEISI